MEDIDFSGIEVEVRRVVIEAISKLVHIKKTSASELLTPAGVPLDAIRRYLTERDATTGDRRSKREAAVAMLDNLRIRGLETAVLKNLVQIIAGWNAFHLAQNEFEARAVVQKAQRLVGALEEYDERERQITKVAAAAAKADEEKAKRQKREEISRQCSLLLAQFDHVAAYAEPHERGYLLEDLFNRVFGVFGFAVVKAFRRNGGGEQIDGAFEMEGWHYIVECRWRERLADIRQLDGLFGQIGRSGKQTMGVFFSVNGWSENVVPLLKQNPSKNLFLMDGFDLRSVLSEQVDLKKLLKEKLTALNLEAEPFYSVSKLLAKT
ncbi:hypothetical protein ACG873_15580 [Mesorhizobium sp. AaZ16]|uniref:hypothetical protein n=1 Tax=Mesorhizobium sp. AaZ16 TaxID=3402289 RepID=UPI00374EBE6C